MCARKYQLLSMAPGPLAQRGRFFRIDQREWEASAAAAGWRAAISHLLDSPLAGSRMATADA